MSPDFGLCRMSFLCRFGEFYGVFMSFYIFTNLAMKNRIFLQFPHKYPNFFLPAAGLYSLVIYVCTT